jgi:hypothetical protein
MKRCLEGGGGKKPSESKENETEKTKKLICSKFRCPNCCELGHRKKKPEMPSTKKRQVI